LVVNLSAYHLGNYRLNHLPNDRFLSPERCVVIFELLGFRRAIHQCIMLRNAAGVTETVQLFRASPVVTSSQGSPGIILFPLEIFSQSKNPTNFLNASQ